MTYRELLETMKNDPNCLWSSEQRSKHFEERYRQWVRSQTRTGKKRKSTGKG